MLLESVEHGPLIWPTIEENGVIRTKKYAKLSTAEKIQADCDMKATNIILQGQPTDIQITEDDPIACLNKAMAFLTVVTFSRGDKGKVILVLVKRVMLLVLKEIMQVERQGCIKETLLSNTKRLRATHISQVMIPGIPDDQTVQTIIPNNAAFQTEDLDTYDSDCDDVSNAKAILMANISNYGSDVSKSGTTAQTVHMLTKPQVFYDNAHKQALGYQNLFYLKKAQWIKPTLYDDIVISDKHVAMSKENVDIAAQIPSANTIVPGMFKLDLEPLAPSWEMLPSQEYTNDEGLGHNLIRYGSRDTNLYTISLDDMFKHLQSVFYPKSQRLLAPSVITSQLRRDGEDGGDAGDKVMMVE
ncbi:hypothetical protein Tco_0788003 [Tanacetum coccineum]